MEKNIVEIKKQILEELGYLSYMEKNKIRDDNDQAFIEKELKAIKKRKKINISSLIFISFALFCLLMSLLYDSKPIISSRNIIGALSFSIVFSLNIFLSLSQLMENNKKETLYRILSVFNKVSKTWCNPRLPA